MHTLKAPGSNIEGKQTEHGEYVYGCDSASCLTSADNPSGEDV